MKLGIKILIICICIVIIVSGVIALAFFDQPKDDISIKTSYSTSYKELSNIAENSTSLWRNGMVSGNGLQGVITSGAPYNDTLIFQNIHFILPNKNQRTCPVSYESLDTIRKQIVNGVDIEDSQSYDDVYCYHAGATLRIAQEKQELGDYKRYTNYSTAEVGVEYSDANGTWKRSSFTSQSDMANITEIEQSSNGTKINTILSIDRLSTMANFGKGDEKSLRYKLVADDDCNYIGLVAHYPSYENSELKNGGYSTICYIVCDDGTKELIKNDRYPETQYVGDNSYEIKITNASKVSIITLSDRTYSLGAFDSFEAQDSFELVDSLVSKTKDVADKYSTNEVFDYQKALQKHLEIYEPIYNAVDFTLYGDESISNDELLDSRLNAKTINNTMAEKAYYSGRYAYICCAGTSTSRLYGMWTGEWACSWGSKYTMDANVNLQTSSMNTSNVSTAPIGYTNFILRQVKDWEENAIATHGMSDAIQAPVNTDGNKAILTESCYPYPFRYWNAGSSWMLQPLYETLQCYGNFNIPISNEYNLYDLKSILSPTTTDLTDEQIDSLIKRGYLDLRKDVLYPLLVKSANYWEQLMVPQYYTDSQGNIIYDGTKTSLSEGETYCIVPSYSPENNPENYNSPSCANTAIDIAACNSNLEMLITIMHQIDSSLSTEKWEKLKEKVPPYLYDSTGALKEWACNKFTENNLHRHLSHLYCAWPLFETQDNESLYNAAVQAINNRKSENKASHALVHRSLIAARLKDSDALTSALMGLMNSVIYYNSLMTNHNTDRSSCYCTDYAIGYLGIVNESLIYSNDGVIEILPALPNSGFEKGEISGIMARTQAKIEKLSWDLEKKKATVTIVSNIDQTIEIKCGRSEQTEYIKFKAGKAKTIDFSI